MNYNEFQFTDRNGKPIPFETLLTTYKDALMTNLLPWITNYVLANWERTSKSDEFLQWLQRNRVWMRLFARDYQAVFATVYEKGTPSNMRQETMDFLDQISVQPDRQHTYWKRYYELMVRNSQITSIDFHTHSPQRYHYPALDNGVVVFEGKTIRMLSQTAYMSPNDYALCYLVGTYDMMPLIEETRQKRGSVIDLLADFSKVAKMYRVYLADNNLVDMDEMPYDRTVLGEHVRFVPDEVFAIRPLWDGTGMLMFSYRFRYLQFMPSLIQENFLVSCSACDGATATKCENCNVPYCSVQCQSIHDCLE